MKKRIFQTAIVSVLVGALLTASMPLQIFAADSGEGPKMYVIENGKKYYTGALTTEDNDKYDFIRKVQPDTSTADIESTAVSTASEPDLSQSMYFPPIKNQGPFGSCTSFALTYYQYTYEVCKLIGMDAKATTENQFSPAWTYTRTNWGSIDRGANPGEVWSVLRYQGAVRESEFPYSTTNGVDWYTNTEAMKDALNIRLDSVFDYSIANPGEKTPIIDRNDTDLRAIKDVLDNGHVLTFSSGPMGYQYKNVFNSPSEWAVVRNQPDNPDPTETASHMMTIVGYNDLVWCDINGDGQIDSNHERGAFKVANSWGTEWMNGGYVWLMYDAINDVGYYDTYDNPNRIPAILNYDCYSISVSRKSPNLIAQIDADFEGENEALELFLASGNLQSSVPTKWSSNMVSYFVNGGNNNNNYTIFLDFSFLCSSLDQIPQNRWYCLAYSMAPCNVKYSLIHTKGEFIRDVIDNLPVIPNSSPSGFRGAGIDFYAPYIIDTVNNCVKGIEFNTSPETLKYNTSLISSVGVNGVYDGHVTPKVISTYTSIVFNDSTIKYAVVRGDVDGDGKITNTDILLTRKYILDPTSLGVFYALAADANMDNVVNVADVMLLQKYMLQGHP